MDVLSIEKTEDTPRIHLDPQSGRLEFCHRSLPEDAIAFYTPILEWLEKYSLNPNKETDVVFCLEYFNTASAKQLFKVITLLANLAKNSKVNFIWKYEKSDMDMLSSGQRFSKLINQEFLFEEVSVG
jgi:hypothetical protein